MKIKQIIRHEYDEYKKFYDITTTTGNFVIAGNNCVVHNSHIKVLLIAAIARFAPELLKRGKIYLAVLPLYGVRNFNGKFLPFYTEEEMIKFRDEHPDVEISRYKGLGEMMPSQLYDCLINPEVRRLIQLTCDDMEFDDIFKLLSDAESKRNLIGQE